MTILWLNVKKTLNYFFKVIYLVLNGSAWMGG